MFSRQVNLFWAVMVLLCCGMANALAAGEPGQEIVNPHWTGRHCAECHLEKDPRVGGAARRFNGDTIALCNRCHELITCAPIITRWEFPSWRE